MQELKAFLIDIYFLEKSLRPSSREQLSIAVDSLDRWHGERVLLSQLCDSLVNRWLLESELLLAPATLKRRRGGVLSVWRYAADTGRCKARPERIRLVRELRRLPVAWSIAEMAMLLRAGRQYPGEIRDGRLWADYWPAFIRVGYDTALRYSDLMSLPQSALSNAGVFRIVQEKTGVEIIRAVHPRTLELIRKICLPGHEMIFALPYCRQTFDWHWHRLLRLAGLPGGRREGPQKLRRTAASHREAASPGSAAMLLGHRTPGMAERHYLDPSITRAEPILPPELP